MAPLPSKPLDAHGAHPRLPRNFFSVGTGKREGHSLCLLCELDWDHRCSANAGLWFVPFLVDLLNLTELKPNALGFNIQRNDYVNRLLDHRRISPDCSFIYALGIQDYLGTRD